MTYLCSQNIRSSLNNIRVLTLGSCTQQVLAAVQWPLDSPVLAQLYLALMTYILMDQASPSTPCMTLALNPLQINLRRFLPSGLKTI